MFYVKRTIGVGGETGVDGITVHTSIEEDNVYTLCPECGKEHQVDIVELLSSGEVDLYGTAVFCKECSAKLES